MRPCKRSQLVELVIPAGATNAKFPYPDIPVLRDDTTQDIIIRSLTTYSSETIPNSPNGNAVATMAQLQNLFLVLYVENEESVQYIPFPRLNIMFQSLSTAVGQQVFEEFELQDLKVDWNKSYIQAAVPPNPEADFTVLLEVHYKKMRPGTWARLTQNQDPGL